jgi:hypothetical protein
MTTTVFHIADIALPLSVKASGARIGAVYMAPLMVIFGPLTPFSVFGSTPSLVDRS